MNTVSNIPPLSPQKYRTVFYQTKSASDAFINPADIIKSDAGFPKICVSTFSKPIIDRFAAMKQVETIGHLYTANGSIPIYKIFYGGREIAFYLSMVGAPAAAVSWMTTKLPAAHTSPAKSGPQTPFTGKPSMAFGSVRKKAVSAWIWNIPAY